MCFVWISEQTAIISLYSINWLVCITETECVYCAVRAESLNIIKVNLIFTGLGTSLCWTLLFFCQTAPYLRSASALAFFVVLVTRLTNVKFDKESPACLASTLNIQTVLAGVVSLFSLHRWTVFIANDVTWPPTKGDVFQKTEVVSFEWPFRFISSSCLLPRGPQRSSAPNVVTERGLITRSVRGQLCERKQTPSISTVCFCFVLALVFML